MSADVPTSVDTGDAGASSGGEERRSILNRDVLPSFKPSTMVRVRYASFLFMALVTCLLLRGSLGKAMTSIPYLRKGCEVANEGFGQYTGSLDRIVSIVGGNQSASVADAAATRLQAALSATCFQNTVVYRISFALALFFLLHFMSVSDLTCCVDDAARAEFQTSFWTLKTGLLALLNIIVFWIPNGFYVVYADICVFASAIFLLMQIALIVDFSYQWNEEWGERSSENTKWVWYLGGMTILSFAAGIAFTIYNFVTFVPEENCNLHGFIITICVLSAVLYTGVAIWVPHGSVLPSGIVFAYTSFLVFSALRASPDARCNPKFTGGPGSQSMGIIIASAVVSSVALAWSVVSVSGSEDGLSLGDDDDGEGSEEGGSRPARFSSGHLPSYLFFHGIMLLGSMYLAMLGSDWQVTGDYTTGSSAVAMADNGASSSNTPLVFWVRIATSWLTTIAYLWSLLAPYYCCRHRDFGYDVSDWE